MAKFVPFYSMGVEIPETKLSEEEIQLFKETLEDHSYIISDETSRKILFTGRHGKVFSFNKLTGRVEVAKNPVKDSEFDLVLTRSMFCILIKDWRERVSEAKERVS